MAKFKRIDTGEIVDVVSWGATGSYTDYYDSKGVFHHTDLNRYDRFEEIIEDTKDGIDWEERRYKIAKEAVNGLLAAPVVDGIDPNPPMDDIARNAVKIADYLIEELKKGEAYESPIKKKL